MNKKQDEEEQASWCCNANVRRRRRTRRIADRFSLCLTVTMVSILLSFPIIQAANDFIMRDKDKILQESKANKIITTSGGTRKIKSEKKKSKGAKSSHHHFSKTNKKSSHYHFSKTNKKSSKGTASNEFSSQTDWQTSAAMHYQSQYHVKPTCKPFYLIPLPPPILTIAPMPPMITGNPITVPPPHTIAEPTTVNNCNMSVEDRVNGILSIIIAISGYKYVMTSDTASPQSKAMQWIIYTDEAQLCPNNTLPIRTRYALAVFYYSTTMSPMPWKNCGADPGTSPCSPTHASSSYFISRSSNDATFVDISSMLDGMVTPTDASIARTQTTTDIQRWLSSSNECSWYGVKCNNQLEPMYIWLDGNNLVGTIPVEISVLSSSLSDISLLHNSLHGNLPSSLGDISNMVNFNVAFNKLSGTVPKSLSNWSILKSFNVEGNSFNGALFSDKNDLFKASFATMEELILSQNLFQGTISPSLGAFTKLTRFILDRNDFTGTIPASVCELRPSLVLLEADCAGTPPQVTCTCCTTCYNASGEKTDTIIMLPTFAPTSSTMIPIFISPPPTAATRPSPPRDGLPIFVPTASTTKPIFTSPPPTSAGDKCNITSVEREKKIRENLRVPSTPQGKKSIDWLLNVDEKYVCPSDPSLFQRYALTALYFKMNGNAWTQCSHNESLPCDDSEDLSSSNNNDTKAARWLSSTSECVWYGISCSPPDGNNNRQVYEIDLHNNNLANEIPYEIGLLLSLKILFLQSNENIDGSLPASMGQLVLLELLDVDMNQIGGELPVELFLLRNLQVLAMSSNRFSGTLPSEIENLSKLTWLELFGNEFTGTIPTQIGSLQNLTVLTVQQTNLNGSMPASVCALREETQILSTLQADCGTPPDPPRVQCDCCTGCFPYNVSNDGRTISSRLGEEWALVDDRFFTGNSTYDNAILLSYSDGINANRTPREWQVIDVIND